MMLRIIGIAICAATAFLVLKNLKSELASYAVLGGALLIIIAVLPNISKVISFSSEIAARGDIADYITPLLKGLGIAYISEFACDICKETGAVLLVSKIESVAKLEIVMLGLPMITNLISYALSLV